jgi:hypothetical protein
MEHKAKWTASMFHGSAKEVCFLEEKRLFIWFLLHSSQFDALFFGCKDSTLGFC